MPAHATKMLFLVSHGLQSPLSAIRWGCGRLQRTGKLSTEQRELLDSIQAEGRLLSRMMNWLLLLAKTDDGVHIADVQEVYVRDFLTACMDEKLPRPLKFRITCAKDLAIQVDRTLLEASLHALLFAASVSSDVKTLPISVRVTSSPEECLIMLDAQLSLTLLEEEQTGKPSRRIAGGMSGFLLAVASSFAIALGGTIDHKTVGAVISDLTLRLPQRPPLPVLLKVRRT